MRGAPEIRRLVRQSWRSWVISSEVTTRTSFAKCRAEDSSRNELGAQANSQRFPQFGEYRVEGVLGRGGMGIVYRARDTKSGRAVAVKTVFGTTPSFQAALRAEIVALKRVRHPSVVRVLSEGVEDGTPWYAMDLVEGETLERFNDSLWLRNKRSGGTAFASTVTRSLAHTGSLESKVSVELKRWRPMVAGGRLSEILAIFRQLCQGLSYLHRLGIVHRDVKPSNVCLRDGVVPVLMDFGLATRTQGGIGREALASPVGGQVLGTVPYVSPEQIRGEVTDARADLYSLGCMLYESLVGWPPFHVGEAHTILRSHLYDVPKPLTLQVAGIPLELERLVMRMLAKTQYERVGHADYVASVLQGLGAENEADSAPPSAFKPYLYRPRLVGREGPLGTIESAKKRLHAGEGSLLLIGGESGIGKTSVAAEAAQRAATSGFEVITSECEHVGEVRSEQGGSPFHPFRSLLQRAGDYLTEATVGGLHIVAEDLQLLSSYEPALSSGTPDTSFMPPSAAPTMARDRVFQALTRVLTQLSRVRPLLWALDDLQWADDLSLKFLASLSPEFFANSPVLIIATYRTDERSGALDRLFDEGFGEQVLLERLGRGAVEAMTQDMLAMRVAPPQMVDFLLRASRGNPFFVAEFLRVAVSEGLIERAAGQWRLSSELEAETTSPLEHVPLTDALKELMSRHMGQLDVNSRDVLCAASVIGLEVNLDLLAHAIGEPVLEPVAILTGEHLLQPGSAGSVRFTHPQLRKFAYSFIESQRRVWLHERVARWIEAQARIAPLRKAQLPILAHHWAEAKSPLRAAVYYLRAGRHAQANYANEDAIRFFESAIRTIDQDQGVSSRMRSNALQRSHERLGDVLRITGESRRAEQHYQLSLATYSRHHPLRRARLLRKIGKARTARHDHEHALEALRAANQVLASSQAEQEPPQRFAEWVEIQLGRGWAYYWTKRSAELDELLPPLGRMIKLRGTVAQLAQYHEAVCFAELRRDRYAVSRRSLEIIRKAARWVGTPNVSRENASIHFALGFALVLHGSHKEACKTLASVARFAHRMGDVSLRIRALTYLCVAYRRQQRVEKTRELAEQSMALLAEHSMDHYLGAGKANLGWALYRSGRPKEAEVELLEALSCWRRTQIAFPFQGLAIWPLARMMESNGRHEAAVELLLSLGDGSQQQMPDELESQLLHLVRDPSAGLRQILEVAAQHQQL